MAELSKVMSLNQESVDSMEPKMLKPRTNVNTVRGRPTARKLCERLMYERTVMIEMSKRSIEDYAISNQLFTVKQRKHYRVFDFSD